MVQASFLTPHGPPELITFGLPMSGFGPCGFICVAVAGGLRLPGHKMVTTYVSQELNSPLRCHVTTELKPLAVLFQ